MPDINALSCVRCKAKKIKCGRQEPSCDKCTATQAACHYPVRRKKAKSAKKRIDIISHILDRLEELEKKAGVEVSGVRPTEDVATRDDEEGIIPDDDEDATDTESGHTENETQFRSLYHLIDEAAITTKNVFSGTEQDAIPDRETDALFDDALASIRAFRWKDDKGADAADDLEISTELALRWIDLCFQLRFCEELFGLTNKNLLMTMPIVLKSPNIQIHYSVIIVYYNALYYGWRSDKSLSVPTWKNYGRKLYRECLKLIPAWKNDGLSPTVMDALATGLLTLMAINNFDYHLAWDLHLACCAVTRELGVHMLDDAELTKRPKGLETELEKNSVRKKFWQLIHVEFFFRLYYDKPATITGSDFSVNFPSVMPASGSLQTDDTIYFLVSSRYCFITKEFLDLVHNTDQNSSSRVNELADQIEELLLEWDISALLANPNGGPSNAWMYADLLINCYTTIILMERKSIKSNEKHYIPSTKSVHAARETMRAIYVLSTLYGLERNLINFISFYPIVAFFTLYYHIISTLREQQKPGSPSIGDIEKDVQLMENLGSTLSSFASGQDEYQLVANTIVTLTGACRRLSLSSDSTPQSSLRTPSGSHAPLKQSSDDKVVEPNKAFTETQSEVNTPTLWNHSEGSPWPDFEASLHQSGMQIPYLYIESMENDLFGKNWHQSWFDQ